MMNPLLKKISFTSTILLFIISIAFSQKEFFRSQQVFKEGQLEKFYSSITIHDSIILFNANDYHLYAYNKNNGSLKWAYKNNYKTTVPVFVAGNIIYAAASKDEEQQAVQISLTDGKLIKELPFGPMQTQPMVKNGILYTTAIYNYGCIVAYDLKKDTVRWSRFIAHGLSRQPYYLENKIMANAEGSNWVELNYDGILLDTTCATGPSMHVEDIPCVRTFAALSHDGLEIKGKLSDDIFGKDFFDQPDIMTSNNFTYILYGDKLSIISKKLKIRQQMEISALVPDLVDNVNSKLLKADDESIWILHADHLLQYNQKTKKLLRQINLTAWQPQQVLFDGENIWLISGKDGLLYGIAL